MPGQLLGHALRLTRPYLDRNGLVADSMREHLELDSINIWSEDEKRVFLNRCVPHVLVCCLFFSHSW